MSFRTILVVVNSPEVSKSTLETALLVAERWRAHLDVLHVRADPRGLVPYTGEGMDGSMIEEIMEVTERESEDRAIQAKKMFDAFCAEKGLVISNTPSAEAAVTVSWSVEAGRDDTGRPVRVAPPEAGTDAGGHIAIAWEASPEAARTIGVSIQALSLARDVTILAPQLSQPLPLHPSELVDRLLWHGITANVHEFAAGAGELGAAFLSQAEAIGADMLVKGAYSQSRLRQMILGGRTRHILKHTTIPTLLAK